MSKSTTSKLTLSFVYDSISYYVNQSQTYFAKKANTDTRMTRISRVAYEAAQAQYEAAQAQSVKAEAIQAPVKSAEMPATVDATPAPIEAPVPDSAPSEVMDGTTRPDWAEMQTFERVTMEDLQRVPACIARGLGFVAMGALKLAAMGIGAMAGLGIMGLRKVMAR